MIDDPMDRGRALAALHRELSPKLFEDLLEAGLVAAGAETQALREWDCFAAYACVRGLVAAGGFNVETGQAIDAFHDALFEQWAAPEGETVESRRRLVSDRYAEYGEIGQAGGAAGADSVNQRLGEAAARHMMAPAEPDPVLIETVAELHESLVDGAAEAIRGQ